MVKTIQVPLISSASQHTPLSTPNLSSELDKLDRTSLTNGWFDLYPYQPQVTFGIAYNNHEIYLKYYVQEEAIAAKFYNSNEPVYQDSCVEFFVAFDEDSYYNLEFNCLGACLMEFGKSRANRLRATEATIQKIKRYATVTRNLSSKGDAQVYWELIVIIPTDVFWQHSIGSLKGIEVRANFQKCGDNLPSPHFLTWNKIDTPQPDFHQPAYFGSVKFS